MGCSGSGNFIGCSKFGTEPYILWLIIILQDFFFRLLFIFEAAVTQLRRSEVIKIGMLLPVYFDRGVKNLFGKICAAND